MLEKLKQGREFHPRRTILYAGDGVGKSSWAAQAPSPIFLATEDGTDDIGVDRTPLIKTYAELVVWITGLVSEPHDYKTVVLDSADWTERLVHKKVAESQNKTRIEDIGYGKGYKLAIDDWGFLLSGFNALRAKGMSIILIAHAHQVTHQPPGKDAYDRHELALNKHAAPILREWADEVFFAEIKVDTVVQEGEFGRDHVRAVSIGGRIMHTYEAPEHVAKRRFKLPDVLPLDYTIYAEHLAAYKDKQTAKSGTIAGIVKNGSSKQGDKK